MSFLSLKGVCKSYGSGDKRTEVLSNLDLEVPRASLSPSSAFPGVARRR